MRRIGCAEAFSALAVLPAADRLTVPDLPAALGRSILYLPLSELPAGFLLGWTCCTGSRGVLAASCWVAQSQFRQEEVPYNSMHQVPIQCKAIAATSGTLNEACVSRACRFCMPNNTFHHGSSVEALSSIERPMRFRPLASSPLLRAAALVITLSQRCTCACRFSRYITYFAHAIWIRIQCLAWSADTLT